MPSLTRKKFGEIKETQEILLATEVERALRSLVEGVDVGTGTQKELRIALQTLVERLANFGGEE